MTRTPFCPGTASVKAELSDTNCNVALYMQLLLLLHIFQLVTAVHVLYSWALFYLNLDSFLRTRFFFLHNCVYLDILA